MYSYPMKLTWTSGSQNATFPKYVLNTWFSKEQIF